MKSKLSETLNPINASFERESIYKALIIGLISLFVCSTLFYYFESPYNNDLSYFDSIWWGFVTWSTVGYGDYYPITLGGRIVAYILMVIGVGAFGFVTAGATSVFIENRIKKGKGLLNMNLKNHIVIIGWNNRSKIIIDEILSQDPIAKIVIIDESESITFDNPNIYFVHGDSMEDEVLHRANIKEASKAIVLANRTLDNANSVDSKSVLTCLAIDSINPDIHLVAEVLKEEYERHFSRAHVNEVIISDHMSSRIIALSVLSQSINPALKELISFNSGNSIYECKVDSSYINKPFKDLVYNYLTEKNAIVVGISNKGLNLNPDKDTVLQENDTIIYIRKDKI